MAGQLHVIPIKHSRSIKANANQKSGNT